MLPHRIGVCFCAKQQVNYLMGVVGKLKTAGSGTRGFCGGYGKARCLMNPTNSRRPELKYFLPNSACATIADSSYKCLPSIPMVQGAA